MVALGRTDLGKSFGGSSSWPWKHWLVVAGCYVSPTWYEGAMLSMFNNQHGSSMSVCLSWCQQHESTISSATISRTSSIPDTVYQQYTSASEKQWRLQCHTPRPIRVTRSTTFHNVPRRSTGARHPSWPDTLRDQGPEASWPWGVGPWWLTPQVVIGGAPAVQLTSGPVVEGPPATQADTC